jgi:hypothetical protein
MSDAPRGMRVVVDPGAGEARLVEQHECTGATRTLQKFDGPLRYGLEQEREQRTVGNRRESAELRETRPLRLVDVSSSHHHLPGEMVVGRQGLEPCTLGLKVGIKPSGWCHPVPIRAGRCHYLCQVMSARISASHVVRETNRETRGHDARSPTSSA